MSKKIIRGSGYNPTKEQKFEDFARGVLQEQVNRLIALTQIVNEAVLIINEMVVYLPAKKQEILLKKIADYRAGGIVYEEPEEDAGNED